MRTRRQPPSASLSFALINTVSAKKERSHYAGMNFRGRKNEPIYNLVLNNPRLFRSRKGRRGDFSFDGVSYLWNFAFYEYKNATTSVVRPIVITARQKAVSSVTLFQKQQTVIVVIVPPLWPLLCTVNIQSANMSKG